MKDNSRRHECKQLREHKASLDKLMLRADEMLDSPCKNDSELESHTLNEIQRNEIYMTEKIGILKTPLKR